jgi:hypothetical protein
MAEADVRGRAVGFPENPGKVTEALCGDRNLPQGFLGKRYGNMLIVTYLP